MYVWVFKTSSIWLLPYGACSTIYLALTCRLWVTSERGWIFSSKACTSHKHLYHAPLAMLTDSFIHIDISRRCSVLFATAPGDGLPALAYAERWKPDKCSVIIYQSPSSAADWGLGGEQHGWDRRGAAKFHFDQSTNQLSSVWAAHWLEKRMWHLLGSRMSHTHTSTLTMCDGFRETERVCETEVQEQNGRKTKEIK